MHKTLTDALYSKCPIIYRNRDAADKENRTLMVWGFLCGSGWYDLLLNLSVSLEKNARRQQQMGIPDSKLPMISQVKEKFGGLRVYMKNGSPELYALIEKAQQASTSICECCGDEGKMVVIDGCVMTRCSNHIGHVAN